MKSVKYIVVTLLMVLTYLFSPHALSQQNNCKLTLGYDSWEPYQYLDVGNKVKGLDIDLLLMVTKRMPCKVEYVQGAWIDLLAQLKKGEVDILLGASKTEKRKQFARFSEPYRTEQFSLYVRKGDKDSHGMNSFNDFIKNGKKLGVVDDYFYGDELSNLRDKDQSNQFVGAIIGEMNIARLLDENIDAFFEDNIVGASMIRRKGLSSLIVPHGLSITTGDVYVMFSKNSVSPETITSFNQSLSEVIKSGEYEALFSLYKQ